MGRMGMFRVFDECSWTAPSTPEHISIVKNKGTMPGDIKRDMLQYALLLIVHSPVTLSLFSLCHTHFTFSILPHL
jgi:hypothetical protein